MNKIGIILLGTTIALSSCNLDYLPNEQLTQGQIAQDPTSAAYVTDGIYAMMKDQLTYKGVDYTGNTYVRYLHQLSEYPSDNVCISGRSTDPLYEVLTYKRTASLANISYMWWCSYKIINGANSILESVADGVSPESDYLKGENYFLRAFAYFNLSTLWSKPYTQGRDNPGVVLRTKTTDTESVRATVGEIYDLIESDLNEAIRLMGNTAPRGNVGFASKTAAQALLARVYLYMERNEEVISLVNEMLGSATPESKLEPTASYPSYFANALNSPETIWAIAHTSIETQGSASIAAMYLTDEQYGGWGEIYASDPMLDLLDRFPNDVRHQFIRPKTTSDTEYMIRWAIPGQDDFYQNELRDVTYDEGTGKYFFNEGAGNVYVETETVNSYPQNFINYGGEKHRVRLSLKMENRNTWPKFFVLKFSYQDGDAMLSSPVMLRWAEVILNRAEAYAKTGQTDKALADVNAIRSRAGLTGDQLFGSSNMMGYADIMDVVLDERRLELCFEGHRTFDVYRNKRNMDRRYSGAQPWEVVDYNDNKIQSFIPLDEITISKIPQNP